MDKPTATEIKRATARIHQALDKGLMPSPGDVNLLELAEIPLEALVASRQETQEKINQVVEPEKLNLSASKSASGKERLPRDKKGKDIYEFVEKRLGPLMILCLFVFVRDWDKARLFSFSPEECHELAGPAANVFSRFEKLFDIPDWVHEVIVSSDDTVTMLYVMVGYLERTGILDKMIHFQFKPPERTETHVDNGHTQGLPQANGYAGLPEDYIGLQHLADR